MNDLEKQRLKRNSKALNELATVTKETGYLLAEACYALAYKVRSIASQMECNERNNEKIKRIK